jgi:hypothetical protein
VSFAAILVSGVSKSNDIAYPCLRVT